MMKSVGLILGPILFALSLLFPNASLSPDAWAVIGVASWMLIWWITEAVPIAVASLLPIILFPLTGVMTIKEACTSYGSHFVFLFLGGFLIALALEKWQLHKRIALGIVSRTGSGANRVILGFMLASALLSMWISNTATTLMMLPIAASVVSLLATGQSKGSKRFAIAMMLGIAYAANVGGIATLIGTPPNAAMAGIIEENYHIEIGFFEWMEIGLPFSLIMLAVVYFVLVRGVYPNKIGAFPKAGALIAEEREKLGLWTSAQYRVMTIFGITALLWIFRGWINGLLPSPVLSDSAIALIGGSLLFVFPAGHKSRKPLMEWEDTAKLPWGILLLFGGGLSLAGGFRMSGLIEIIAAGFGDLNTGEVVLIITMLAFVALFLTELMSNLALVNVLVPVVAAIGFGGEESPLLFAVPVTLAASCAFMFPMSTPPNAIVFASGHVKIMEMARVGIVLNLIAVLVTAAFCYFVMGWWLT